jgi:hypothetical protein
VLEQVSRGAIAFPATFGDFVRMYQSLFSPPSAAAARVTKMVLRLAWAVTEPAISCSLRLAGGFDAWP